MVDVAERAGVSVGLLYQRFRDKRAFLHLLQEELLADLRRALDQALGGRKARGGSLHDLARIYISVMVRKFRQHRSAILAIQRHIESDDASEIAARNREFNTYVRGRLQDAFASHQSEITHPEPATALMLAIFFASAAAREAIWYDKLQSYPVRLSDRKLIEELTRSFVRFLCA